MNVLGLDLSLSSTGVCVVENDTVVKLQLITTPTSWATGKRLTHIVRTVGCLWAGVDEIGIEDTFYKVNFGSYKGITKIGGAMQEAWYEFTSKEAHLLMATHARAVCGLDGHAPKAEIQLAVGCWLGIIGENDAVFLGHEIRHARSLKLAKKRKSELDKLERRIPRMFGKVLMSDVADAAVVARALLAKHDCGFAIAEDFEFTHMRGKDGGR